MYRGYYPHEIQKNFQHSLRLEVETHSLPQRQQGIVLATGLLLQKLMEEIPGVFFPLQLNDLHQDNREYALQ